MSFYFELKVNGASFDTKFTLKSSVTGLQNTIHALAQTISQIYENIHHYDVQMEISKL